jgi:hypothetical protein
MIQIDEVGAVGERIIRLVDYFCQGNKTAFGRAADIQSGVLAGIVGGRESKPGFEILQKLLTAYPTVNPIWLLFGRGPMIQSENVASPQSQPILSAEQFEFVRREIKELIVNRLGLGPAEARRIEAVKARTEQIIALDVKTMTLKMSIDELTTQIQSIKSKVEVSDQDTQQLTAMNKAHDELVKDWHGSLQVLFALRAEEKQDLREAQYLIDEMTQAVQVALKASS